MKKAFLCTNDDWKFDLFCNSENCLNKVERNNTTLGTTLSGIAKSFRTFAEVFAKVESNYLHTLILNNPQFGYANRGESIFDEQFFQPQNSNITWGMLTDNLLLKSIEEVRNIAGEGINREKYEFLKVGWKRAKKIS